jgi:hypothetical protein
MSRDSESEFLISRDRLDKKSVGVLFYEVDASACVESILTQLVDVHVVIVALNSLIYDKNTSAFSINGRALEDIACNCASFSAHNLEGNDLSGVLSFMAIIDELYVISGNDADNKTFDFPPFVEELLIRAKSAGLPTQFFDKSGLDCANVMFEHVHEDAYERVALKDAQRKNFNQFLSVVRMDNDWSASGLSDEKLRMISLDSLYLPYYINRMVGKWQDDYEATFDEVMKGTGPSEEWDERHEERARVIALEMQKFFGDSITVQVCGDGGWVDIS